MDSLRAGIETRLARLRSLGWRGLFQIQRDTQLRLLKTTLAATLAWEVASLLNNSRPALAALGAILVVQATVHASLARSIQVTIGVTLGLVAAVALGDLLGLHWWSVALVVLGALVAGEILHLGASSAQAATSALLALSLGSAYGSARAIDTALGAVIGVLVNALIAPPSYVQSASSELRRVSEDVAALLSDIGTGLSRRLERGTVERWLARARTEVIAVRRAGDTVLRGEESLRFNPLGRADLTQLERLDHARRALAHVVTQVRGIARSLLDIVREEPEAAHREILETFGDLLRALGKLVQAFGRLQQRPDDETDRRAAIAARTAAVVAHDRVLGALGELSSPHEPVARQLTAMLVDAERLLHEVDPESGAHTGAVDQPTTE